MGGRSSRCSLYVFYLPPNANARNGFVHVIKQPVRLVQQPFRECRAPRREVRLTRLRRDLHCGPVERQAGGLDHLGHAARGASDLPGDVVTGHALPAEFDYARLGLLGEPGGCGFCVRAWRPRGVTSLTVRGGRETPGLGARSSARLEGHLPSSNEPGNSKCLEC